MADLYNLLFILEPPINPAVRLKMLTLNPSKLPSLKRRRPLRNIIFSDRKDLDVLSAGYKCRADSSKGGRSSVVLELDSPSYDSRSRPDRGQMR